MSALSCLPNFIIYLSKFGLKIKTSENKDRIIWHLFKNGENQEIRIKKTNIDNRYVLKWIYNEIEIKNIAEETLKNFLYIYYEKDTKIIPYPNFEIVNNTDITEFSYLFIKNKMEKKEYRLSSQEWTDETSILGNICFFDILNKIVTQIDYDVNENNIKIVIQENKTDYITNVILHLINSYKREKVKIIYYKQRLKEDIDNTQYLSDFFIRLNYEKEETFDGWRNKIIWKN